MDNLLAMLYAAGLDFFDHCSPEESNKDFPKEWMNLQGFEHNYDVARERLDSFNSWYIDSAARKSEGSQSRLPWLNGCV